MARPGSQLEIMFRAIATPEQMRTLRESFFNKKNYGGACTYMCRIMMPVWFEKMGKSRKNKSSKVQQGVSTPVQAEEFDIPRLNIS